MTQPTQPNETGRFAPLRMNTNKPNITNETGQHRPGPWQAKEQYRDCVTNDSAFFVLWPDTSKPGVWMRRLDDKGAFSEADARLIAAAPDLVAALEGMLACNKELGAVSRPVADQARAALARAKGKE